MNSLSYVEYFTYDRIPIAVVDEINLRESIILPKRVKIAGLIFQEISGGYPCGISGFITTNCRRRIERGVKITEIRSTVNIKNQERVNPPFSASGPF